MQDLMHELATEVDASDMSDAKKVAALALVSRLNRGEAIGRVLRDLAEPLELTDEMIMRHLQPADAQSQ